ncbi:MAG: hypothetical protein U1D25_01735 [Hydrogenophaga sp.]|uniref:DoxX family protein n=1 Tax=Hydrogenophaga sp. TaxID=1904254 RepID=UPI002746AD89|nr:hypothetical protein [Hydrogenophaga sp.]MDP2417141.1 hypothetical protein [Hydrogenophaga sp.]MDZ4186817.1 hypothetical protein [Hydrogenophaga sp.]
MTTPLLMLALLTLPWCAAALYSQVSHRTINLEAAGRFGLALAFLFAGSGHFLMTDTMALMLPPWVPARVPLVLVTGVLEIAIAIGLLVPYTRRLAAWSAAVVLVAFFPANVYAAWQQVPMGGHAWGLVYLWIRAPLQIVLLTWTWRFGLERSLAWSSASGQSLLNYPRTNR